MSKRALSRLCGVRHSTIQVLLDQSRLADKILTESLKPLQDKDLWIKMVAHSNVEVIGSGR